MAPLPFRTRHRWWEESKSVVSERCQPLRGRGFLRRGRRAGRSSGRKEQEREVGDSFESHHQKRQTPISRGFSNRAAEVLCASRARHDRNPRLATGLSKMPQHAQYKIKHQSPRSIIVSRQNKTRIGLHQDHAIARSLRYPDASLRILGGIRDPAGQSTRVIASGGYWFPQRR